MMDKLRRILARTGAWIDDLLFPEKVTCLCCDYALGEADTDGLCRGCRCALEGLAAAQEAREAEQQETLPDGIDYIHAAYVYDGPVRKLVHRLKYESVRAAAVPLAKQMVFLPSGEEELIVPVPTDPRRERLRGFNQSALLAEHIAKELGMPMEKALTRVEARRPQTGLPLCERRANLVGCMTASRAVRGKRVLLVDDVCTSGATVCEAARALREAGVVSVGVFAAARTAGDEDGSGDPFAPVFHGRANGEISRKERGKTRKNMLNRL